MLNKQAYNLL